MNPQVRERPRPASPAPTGARRRLAGVFVLLAWVGALLLGTLGTATPAAAHAELTSSDPAANAQLDASPAEVRLRFTEGVTLIDDGFRLLGQDAVEQPLGAAASTGTEVTVPLSGAVPDGAYVLVYRVVSADSHPIAGALPFTVGAAAAQYDAPGGQAGTAEADLGTGVSGTVRILSGVDRWAGYAGVVLLLGVPAFVVLCWPRGARDPVVRRLTVAGAVVVVVSALASLPLQAAYATGASLGRSFRDGSIPDLLSRSAGHAALGRMVLAVLVGVLFALAAHRRTQPVVLGAWAASGALLLSFSWAGHAAVAEYPALTMADDGLHLAAVAVWVGGLVLLAVRLLPAPVPELPAVLVRWSRTAMAAVAVLVVTGSVQAWRELRSVSALVDTEYGRWVLAKIAGLVLLVALGNLARRRVRRYVAGRAAGPGTPPGAHTERVGASLGAMLAEPSSTEVSAMRRSVLAEVAIAAAVLAATAVLVVTTPGRGSTATNADGPAGAAPTSSAAPAATPAPGPATASVDLPNQVKVEVSVDPPTPGTPTISITVRSLTGAVIDPPEVTAYAALPASGIEGIPLALRRTEAGRYIADGAPLSFPGDWQITVTVRTTDVDSGVGTVSVHLQ